MGYKFNPFTVRLDNVNRGDITSVIAGTNLNGGGTSGDVTLNVNSDLDNINSIQFDITNTPLTNAEGLLQWNSTDGTLDLGMDGGAITQQIGQELFTKVRNESGYQTITNGQAVYISGRNGVFPTVRLARADAESTSRVLGIATQDIASPDFGFITTLGYVRGIKTNYTGTGIWGTTWVTGDLLYVSKTDAGTLTNVEPSAPHHSDTIGTVGVVSANQGSILITLDRHKTLEQLTDVDGTALTTTGQLPVWDQVNGFFDFDYNITNYLLTSDFTDANISISDITTNNATTLKHGFLPKLSGSATQYLNGSGNYVTIAGTGVPSGYSEVTFTGQTSVNVVHDFGIKPLIQVLDSNKDVFIAYNVRHNTDNDFTVTFDVSTSGTIISSAGREIPNITTISTNYTVLTNDNIIVSTARNITVTLPTAVGATGKEYSIDNASNGNITVVGTGGETIWGETSQIVPTQSTMVVYSTGSNWRVT